MEKRFMKFFFGNRDLDAYAVKAVETWLPKETGIDRFVSNAIRSTVQSNRRLASYLTEERQPGYMRPLVAARAE